MPHPRRLLYIIASPRKQRSRSGDVADHLLAALRAADGAIEVETLDLWAEDLPAFDAAIIEGRYCRIMGEAVAPEIADAWEVIRQRVDHFLSFDAWLIATPMWNFGLPYRLKHYIDLITQPGMAFTNDAEGNHSGLAAGRTAYIVAASALDIRADNSLAELDFQQSYLAAWLEFIGVTDIRSVRVAPTFGPEGQVDRAMNEARAEAERIAAAP